jgi:hypothetical protein
MTDLNEGMENLWKGSLVYLLAVAFSWASVIPLIATGFTAGDLINPALIASLGALAILIVAAIVLGIASFVYLFMATGALRKANERYGIGRKGMILILVGLILFSFSLILALFAAATGASEEIALLIVGIIGLLWIIAAVLLLIGVILFGIMLLRLEDVDSRFKTAGIIYLIGIIVPFLIIAAMILVYSAANRAIKGAQAVRI